MDAVASTISTTSHGKNALPPVTPASYASPKLRPACVFNNFIKLPTARSDDATLRLRRSQSPVRTPVVASLSAPAHPYTKINVFWNRGSKRCNFSNRRASSHRSYVYTPSYISLAGAAGTSPSLARFTFTRRPNSLSGSRTRVPSILSPDTLNCHNPCVCLLVNSHDSSSLSSSYRNSSLYIGTRLPSIILSASSNTTPGLPATASKR